MPRSNLITAAASAFLAFVSVALFLVLLDRDSAPPIVIEGDPSLIEIAILIEGAVATPGIYRLSADARLADAVAAAGGFTAGADVTDLNLAARLDDEQKIVIPFLGTDPGVSPIARPQSDDDAATSDLIDINTATAGELEELPGIGPVLAERIVAYRDANGPFTRVEELARVEGISLAMVDEMRDLIAISP